MSLIILKDQPVEIHIVQVEILHNVIMIRTKLFCSLRERTSAYQSGGNVKRKTLKTCFSVIQIAQSTTLMRLLV